MRLPVVHLSMQSVSPSHNAFHRYQPQFEHCTCILFACADLVFNCIAQFDLLSKMVSVEQEQEIVFLTKVSKIHESNALDIQEVGFRFQDFDQVLEVIFNWTFTFRSQPCGLAVKI